MDGEKPSASSWCLLDLSYTCAGPTKYILEWCPHHSFLLFVICTTHLCVQRRKAVLCLVLEERTNCNADDTLFRCKKKRHSVRFRITFYSIDKALINSKIICIVLQSVGHKVEIIVCTLDYKQCHFKTRVQVKSWLSHKSCKQANDTKKWTDV